MQKISTVPMMCIRCTHFGCRYRCPKCKVAYYCSKNCAHLEPLDGPGSQVHHCRQLRKQRTALKLVCQAEFITIVRKAMRHAKIHYGMVTVDAKDLITGNNVFELKDMEDNIKHWRHCFQSLRKYQHSQKRLCLVTIDFGSEVIGRIYGTVEL